MASEGESGHGVSRGERLARGVFWLVLLGSSVGLGVALLQAGGQWAAVERAWDQVTDGVRGDPTAPGSQMVDRPPVTPTTVGVGRAEVSMPDGTTVVVMTAGYAQLSEAVRAQGRRLNLHAKATRPTTPDGETVLWLNVRDDTGQTVPGLTWSDLQIIDGGREVGRARFGLVPGERPPAFAPPHIWIANSDENSVSKLSTRSGRELARHGVSANPSRTAVDLDGHVYVAHRHADDLTKILATGCEGEACLAWKVRTCYRPQGVAVDAENGIWVGGGTVSNAPGRRGCLQLRDAETGEVRWKTDRLPAAVHGLALDQQGVVWGLLRDAHVLMEVSGEEVTFHDVPAPHDIFGIAIDLKGRVWISNYRQADVLRFDPADGRWERFRTPHASEPRGLAADVAGNIWVANSGTATVSRFEAETGRWIADYPTGGKYPVGVAIDGDQFVWVINMHTNDASKLDPETGDVVGRYPVGEQPYTYSDMTGYALHNFVDRPSLYRVAWHAQSFDLHITRPEAGARVATGQGEIPLRVRVDNFDAGDPVVAVRWEVDGRLIDEVDAPPFGLDWRPTGLTAGPHQVRAEARTRSGATRGDAVGIEALPGAGRIAISFTDRAEPPTQVVELVLDSSGSMWGVVGEERKVDVAKRVLLESLRVLEEDAVVGLRAYGHRTKKCSDTALVVPLGTENRERLAREVRALRPRGNTPIARSLVSAASDLAGVQASGGQFGERMIVLVTDGVETCEGDPCAEARRIATSESPVKVHVIGFALDPNEDRASLRCVAEVTGGSYTDAGTPEELTRGVQRALEVVWEVVDATGQVVHRAGIDVREVTVPVGSYRVRVGASVTHGGILSQPFSVAPGRSTRLELAVENDGRLHIGVPGRAP